jgi:hypothetical protein
MIGRSRGRRRFTPSTLALAICLSIPQLSVSQAPTASVKPGNAETASTLEQEFFAAIREGDSKKVLSYVPGNGVNLGAQAQHTSREEIEQQFRWHQGLFCKLFDSSCIDAPVNLENSAPTCSYRELLTHSEKAHTAASEMARNGVQQAVLVATVKNNQCPNQKLIDFIFNLEADGWKLFSIP